MLTFKVTYKRHNLITLGLLLFSLLPGIKVYWGVVLIKRNAREMGVGGDNLASRAEI